MGRLNFHFLCPSHTAPEASLVTAKVLWLSSQESALARSAETAVSPHHNNQTTTAEPEILQCNKTISKKTLGKQSYSLQCEMHQMSMT
jgi:hypothetical protein